MYEARRVTIRDVRPIAADVSLDREGFALIDATSAVEDFHDDEQVRAIYYPEVEGTLRAETGAERALIFDHTVRRRVPGAEDGGSGLPRQPVPRVHVDHTARSGPQNVRDRLGIEAEALLRGRVRIVKAGMQSDADPVQKASRSRRYCSRRFNMFSSHVIDISGTFAGAAVSASSGYRFIAVDPRVELLDGTEWVSLSEVRRVVGHLLTTGMLPRRGIGPSI